MTIFLMLAGFSLFAHFQGTYSDAVRDWNMHPQIFDNQQRLWDWSDIPIFQRGYGN